MHPGMLFWWKNRSSCGQQGEAGAEASACGPGGGHGHSHHGHHEGRGWGERDHMEASGEGGDFGGGAFGVRRPLRFLAYKLGLDEKQVGDLARILSDLKTERAQADVDGRRSVAALADAVQGSAFEEAKAGEAATLRVKTAERLRDAVVSALRHIHALLTDEQRGKLAYLIRTGVVSI